MTTDGREMAFETEITGPGNRVHKCANPVTKEGDMYWYGTRGAARRMARLRLFV